MSRIQLMDTGKDMLVKMADGNPGAVIALLEIAKHGAQVDPETIEGGICAIMQLDTLEIYGSDIHILWSDQCKKVTRELLMLLRASQLGFVSHDRIKAVASDQTRQVRFSQEEMDVFDEKVCKRLPRFQPREVKSAETKS